MAFLRLVNCNRGAVADVVADVVDSKAGRLEKDSTCSIRRAKHPMTNCEELCIIVVLLMRDSSYWIVWLEKRKISLQQYCSQWTKDRMKSIYSSVYSMQHLQISIFNAER